MTGEDDEARRPFDVHYGKGVKGNPWRHDASTDHHEASGTVNDHLPECRVRTYTTDDGMVYEVAGDLCICPALRACEQRIFRESVSAGSAAYDEGYEEGVQAARDAVAAAYDDPAPMKDGMTLREEIAEMYGRKVMFEDAIDAIDALKGVSE